MADQASTPSASSSDAQPVAAPASSGGTPATSGVKPNPKQGAAEANRTGTFQPVGGTAKPTKVFADENADDALDAAYDALVENGGEGTKAAQSGEHAFNRAMRESGKRSARELTQGTGDDAEHEDPIDGAEPADADGDGDGQPAGKAKDDGEAPRLGRISDEAKNLLKRFKHDLDDPETVDYLNGLPERTFRSIVANLKERQVESDRMAQELAQLKKATARGTATRMEGRAEPAADHDSDATADGDDGDEDPSWRAIAEYGPEFAALPKAVQKIATRAVQQHVGQAMAQATNVGEMLLGFMYQQALPEVAKLLPGVDLSKEANQQKLWNEAIGLFSDGQRFNLHPVNSNFHHAILKAANLAFPQDIRLAERRSLATSQRRAVKGSPDPGGRSSRTGQPATLDQGYDAVLDSLSQGADAATAAGVFESRIGRR